MQWSNAACIEGWSISHSTSTKYRFQRRERYFNLIQE